MSIALMGALDNPTITYKKLLQCDAFEEYAGIALDALDDGFLAAIDALYGAVDDSEVSQAAACVVVMGLYSAFLEALDDEDQEEDAEVDDGSDVS